MKTNQMFFLSSVISIALAGFAASQDKSPVIGASRSVSATVPASAPGTNTMTSSGFPIIGYLEKRDRVITIKSTPKGPVYNVATKDGKVLFENLSSEQLKAQASEIHEFIKTAIASNAGKNATVFDARVKLTEAPIFSTRPR